MPNPLMDFLEYIYQYQLITNSSADPLPFPCPFTNSAGSIIR